MKITTYTLMKNCKGTKRLDLYLEKYKDELFDKPLHVYLRSLAVEKGISPAQIATQSGLGDYIYKIWSGVRKPTRNAVLSIAFGMRLSVDETQLLLRIGGFAGLDPRRRRDSALIFALEKEYVIIEANELLDEIGEPLL